MKTVHLEDKKLNLAQVLKLAELEPVLLLAQDGREFYVTEADDFEREVEVLRASAAFQKFLDDRSACKRRIPLEEIEAEIELELANQKRKPPSRKPSRRTIEGK